MENDDDLEGIVAFGIYKSEEIEWTNDFQEKHGREPSEEEINGFLETHTSSRLERLRASGRDALASFAFSLMQENIVEQKKEAIEKSILNEVKNQNSFLKNAIAGAIGSVFVTIAIIALLFVALSDLSLKEFLMRLISSGPPTQ